MTEAGVRAWLRGRRFICGLGTCAKLSTLWRKYGNVFGVVTPASAGPRSGAKAGVQEFWIPAFAGMTGPLAPLNHLSREYVTAFRTWCTKIRLLYEQSREGAAGALVGAGLMCAALWGAIPTWRLGVWFLCLAGLHAGRLLV